MPQTVVQEVIRHVGGPLPWGKISEVVEQNLKPDGKRCGFFSRKLGGFSGFLHRFSMFTPKIAGKVNPF